MTTQSHLSRRQARWLNFFSEFNLNIIHIPGKTNVADYLSRIPVQENAGNKDEYTTYLAVPSTKDVVIKLCSKYNIDHNKAILALHSALTSRVPVSHITCKYCNVTHLDE